MCFGCLLSPFNFSEEGPPPPPPPQIRPDTYNLTILFVVCHVQHLSLFEEEKKLIFWGGVYCKITQKGFKIFRWISHNHQLKVDDNFDDKHVMKIDQVKLTSKLLPCMIVCLYLIIEAIVCVQKNTHPDELYTGIFLIREFCYKLCQDFKEITDGTVSFHIMCKSIFCYG